MDTILIEDLLVRCVIGVFPEERQHKQNVIFNIALAADLRKAGQSDDLADTVDYKHLKHQIVERVETSSYQLIEKLAQEVADICLATPGVEAATVRVDKQGALNFARSVAVEIHRERRDQT